MYRVLKAEERSEDEVYGRRITKGSWGEQEEQRREEREGRRGRRMARWARWVTWLVAWRVTWWVRVVSLVRKVTSAWEGERRRLEARESRWEEDCIRNISLSSKKFFDAPVFI